MTPRPDPPGTPAPDPRATRGETAADVAADDAAATRANTADVAADDAAAIAADVDAELRFHLESRAEALEAEGLSPDAARARALGEFGDLDDARREMRRATHLTHDIRRRRDYMGDLRHDVIHALRRLRATPVFTLTALVTLALGIGANAAIFSVVNGVLLRPLPYPSPDDLYAVYTANRTSGNLEGAVSPVDADDWRANRRVIEDIGGFWYAEGSSGVNLSGRGTPRRLSSVFFTPGFLRALAVRPEAGRLPRENEMVRGGPDDVVMLTHGFWMREFGGDPSVVGSTITLEDQPFAVIGVLPPELNVPVATADVFIPYSTIPDTSIPRLRQVRVLFVVARAKPGVTIDEVRAEMNAVTGRLAAEYQENANWDGATVRPLADVIVGTARRSLWVLFAAVGLVLLMACVNVAALQLARALGRSREMAVRLALGARRGRLVRQLLTESLVLSLAGGVLGLAVASWGLTALIGLSAGQLPRSEEIALDGAVVGFTAVLAVATGLLFGLLPAWRASDTGGAQVLREGGRGIAGAGHRRWRRALIVTEVAVSMILVVGAGLMTRSFLALTHVDLGFRADHLLAVQFTMDPDRFGPRDPNAPAGAGSAYALAYQDIIDRVRTLPGVVDAAAVKDPPFRGNGERNGFLLPGQTLGPTDDQPTATAIHVSEGYFRTIGARMIDGREFTSRDRGDAPFVVVVNEAFQRQFFPGARATGQVLRMGRGVPVEIVGVVNDIRQVAVAEPARPTIYLHNLQNSRVKTTIVARTAGDPLALTDAVQRAVWSVDPQQPITSVFTFDDAVSRALSQPRLLTVLLGAFGIVGLLLGAVGVYGLLAATVSEQRHEFGVRLALGARPGQVLGAVVRRGLGVTLTGVAIGLAGALGLSRFLGAVLYDVAPADPATFAATAGVLLGVAALASWLPARRAAGLDPAETLRE
ncbi:MAG: ABC transporter permease [Vicinamibacterales bacterium]